MLITAVCALVIGGSVTQFRLATRLSEIEDDVRTLKARKAASIVSEAGSTSLTIPKEPVPLKGAAIRGERTAAVAVVEYADFQCEFCARFAVETMPELEKLYINPKKVLFAFRHLPLSQTHAGARLAAEGAECANRQGFFWQMHRQLFHDSSVVSEAKLQTYATKSGLNSAAFMACIRGQAAAAVSADVESARALGISATPTFLIGAVESDGRVRVQQTIVGFRQAADFASVLDKVLSSLVAP
jgi:protein-disulfide isomerase